MPAQQDDNAIIRRVIAGQANAYSLLVARYQQYVFTIILRYEPRRELAEELAQDVFVKAYKALKDFRAESRFSTWLYTIVHTTCLSQLRKKPGITHAMEASDLELLADQFPRDSTADFSERRSQKLLIETAIKMLQPDDAEVLTLFYQAEQSLEEIAHITGTSAATMKVKLHRARQKLRGILINRFPGEILHLMHA